MTHEAIYEINENLHLIKITCYTVSQLVYQSHHVCCHRKAQAQALDALHIYVLGMCNIYRYTDNIDTKITIVIAIVDFIYRYFYAC